MDVWCFPEIKTASTVPRRRLGVEAIGDVMRRSRLKWHGHVERKGDADCVKACVRLLAPVSWPRKTSQNTLSADILC